jgi:RHS repeat-associated protein
MNAKEKDDEIVGSGNNYDFGARHYDSRLGRWLSVDPLAIKYPHMSPHNFTGNNPISNVDPDGRSIKPVNKDAEKLLKATFDYFGGAKFAAALNITDRNGVVRSNLINMDAANMNINEFTGVSPLF